MLYLGTRYAKRNVQEKPVRRGRRRGTRAVLEMVRRKSPGTVNEVKVWVEQWAEDLMQVLGAVGPELKSTGQKRLELTGKDLEFYAYELLDVLDDHEREFPVVETQVVEMPAMASPVTSAPDNLTMNLGEEAVESRDGQANGTAEAERGTIGETTAEPMAAENRETLAVSAEASEDCALVHGGRVAANACEREACELALESGEIAPEVSEGCMSPVDADVPSTNCAEAIVETRQLPDLSEVSASPGSVMGGWEVATLACRVEEPNARSWIWRCVFAVLMALLLGGGCLALVRVLRDPGGDRERSGRTDDSRDEIRVGSTIRAIASRET